MSVNYTHCLRPGTPVSTTDGGVSGKVVGVASIGPAGIGHTYIVHLDVRSVDLWKAYPYECAAIPRCLLRVHGTENIVANYVGDVHFYEEGQQKTPIVSVAQGARRKLYEPYTINFSFKDEEDIYKVMAEMIAGVWQGTYEMFQDGIDHPIYHGALYQVVVEDRQGTLILNASMEEAGSPQHITLRAKCVGELAEVEEEEDV